MTSSPPSADRSEHLAHLAADLVLQHDLAGRFSFETVQTLLAISRQAPAVDPDHAMQVVTAALTAIVTAEVMALREGQP